MAVVKDIYRYLDEIVPFATQMSFDNAGFLVGHGEQRVEKILVALDITGPVVAEAARKGCGLIVAHHPVIFHPAKSITDDTVNGRILLALAEQRIAAICAHTNLDAAVGGVNCALAQRLELTDIDLLVRDGVDGQGRPYGIGRVGTTHREWGSVRDFAAFVKERLEAPSVRYADGGRPVRRVAVGGGSCGSMLAEAAAAGCDTFVTADVKHDQYLEAAAMGITLMDAGHFDTENVIVEPLARLLADQFPGVEVLVSEDMGSAYQSL